MLTIAQIPIPTSVELAGWTVCALAAIAAMDRVLKFYKDHVKEVPPPANTYTTKAHCTATHAAQDLRLAELRAEIRSEMRKDTDGLRGDIQRLHERIDVLETTVGAMPDRVVALLLNTRQLNRP